MPAATDLSQRLTQTHAPRRKLSGEGQDSPEGGPFPEPPKHDEEQCEGQQEHHKYDDKVPDDGKDLWHSQSIGGSGVRGGGATDGVVVWWCTRERIQGVCVCVRVWRRLWQT